MDTLPRGGEADLVSLARLRWTVCDSRDIALSPLVLSDPSSSMEVGCQGTGVAEASSVHLSPALLLGVLLRVHRMGKRAPFWPGPSILGADFSSQRLSVYKRAGVTDRTLRLIEEIPPDGSLSSLRWRVRSVTPTQRGGSYRRDHRGGTSRSFWSLNRGC